MATTEIITDKAYTIAPCQVCQALEIDGDGVLHVAYQDASHRNVYHAYRDGDGWHNQIVHTATEEIYGVSLALDRLGNPSILLTFRNTYPGPYTDNTILRPNGGMWDVTEIPSQCRLLTHLYDQNNRFHVMFYLHSGYGTAHQTRDLYWDGSSWTIECVPLLTGKYESNGGFAVLDTADNICFVYTVQEGDGTPNTLVVSKKIGESWTAAEGIKEYTDTCTKRDKTYYYMPQYMTMAIDRSGYQHIIFSLGSIGGCGPYHLEYWVRDQSGWKSEIIDPGTILPRSECLSKIVLDSTGQPHWLYRTPGNEIRYVHKKDGVWDIQTVTTDATFMSIAIDKDDVIHSIYNSASEGGLVYTKLGQQAPIHEVHFVVPTGCNLIVDDLVVESTSLGRLTTILKSMR